jgi:hypothetical protein
MNSTAAGASRFVRDGRTLPALLPTWAGVHLGLTALIASITMATTSLETAAGRSVRFRTITEEAVSSSPSMVKPCPAHNGRANLGFIVKFCGIACFTGLLRKPLPSQSQGFIQRTRSTVLSTQALDRCATIWRMTTWFKIWTPIGLVLCYLLVGRAYPQNGEFGRLFLTACCLPGVLAAGMIPALIVDSILKHFRKVQPKMGEGSNSGGGIVKVASR